MNPKRQWWWVVAAMLACVLGAAAAVPETVRDKIEVSLLLTGTVDVTRDGSVAAYAIDRREVVPGPVLAFVDRNLPAWQFEPMRRVGDPIAAHARMTLRVVAKPVAGDVFKMSIAGVSFDTEDGKDTDRVRARRLKPPKFPREAVMIGGRGTVYVAVRVNRLGKAEDVFIEQVNLMVAGTDEEMARLRELLGRAAVEAARDWTFRPPTTGEHAHAQSWPLRVPVEFSFFEDQRAYGMWRVYLPGPRQVAPWADDGASADAAVEGQIRLVGGGLKLKTPLPES